MQGSLGERAAASLAAGCDVAVHCNGVMAEMLDVADKVGPLTEEAQRRLARSWTVFDQRAGGQGRIKDVESEVAKIVRSLANA